MCHVLLLLCHTLFPAPLCAASWEMRSCLKRVRSPTGSQPPRLSESTVRERLRVNVRFLVSRQMFMMLNDPQSVWDLPVQLIFNVISICRIDSGFAACRCKKSAQYRSLQPVSGCARVFCPFWTFFFFIFVSLQVSTSTWIRTTTACWAKRSFHATARLRSPRSSWTECFRSASPMMEKWYNQTTADGCYVCPQLFF